MNFNEWLNEKKNKNTEINVIGYEDIKCFINSVRCLLFPGVLEEFDNLEDYLNEKTKCIRDNLSNLLHSCKKIECFKCDMSSKEIADKFLEEIPNIDYLLSTDIEAIYNGDPAAANKTEIILCYPGLFAITVYRVAHVLYEMNIPILPRVLSEYAHSKTGIDIHPGAKIAESFFIDHGTGIVIGQTCEIGKNVKIYQGVTLGALSLREGHALHGVKRHPTIEDDVTIYSGASIFGGNTIIGKNTTIGSNAFITKSVDENMMVTIKETRKKKME